MGGALASLLTAGAAQAAVTVEPVKQRVARLTALNAQVGGRAVDDKAYVVVDSPFLKKYTHQWPGTYFAARFDGTRAYFKVDDSSNILNIRVDGKIISTLTKPGAQTYVISGLDKGPHDLRIERLTETQSGNGTFYGFAIPSNEKALPVTPHARQIEFIGDSYTVGYGNTAGKRTCTKDEIWATTDNSQAFGPLTAKHYNADYQINAFSGRGMVRNYGGFIGDPLPALYPYALYDGKTVYNNPDWKPQIIVIGLGTNDFTTPLHDGEKWKSREELHADYEATYVRFVQSLRAKNPDAWFILMATDQVDGEIQSEAQRAMAAIQAAGETRISFLPMNNLNFGGCDFHPDTADDRKVSDELIAWIDAHPEIWQGK
ncbi:MAG: GDSL-type esterase/lipase family protein [Asticcacaulis sp.]|uniref:SGNH/GDSL hydrolase family protein n=1 Tax=Asticcacaulis sp. TaxID=1872648 RepID=UPI0039E467B3